MKRLVLTAVAGAVLAGVSIARITRPAGVLHDIARARPVRVFTPRFSIPTEYRPCISAQLPADSTVLREVCGDNGDAPVAITLLAGAGESIHPDTLQALALSAVLWWDRDQASLSGAIERLLKALRLDGDSIPNLVDLSGTYLIRAQQMQYSHDLVRALDHAEHALVLDPGNVAALYNAAIASEALTLDGRAVKHWDAYLAADSSSPWREDALARRALVARRRDVPKPDPSWSAAKVDSFTASYPQLAREAGWNFVLGAWGSAVLNDSASEAASLLLLAGRLGSALARRPGGDASLADAVDSIRAARDSATIRILAEAHRSYAAGQKDLIARNDSAEEAFSRVLELRPPSPALVTWARVFRNAALVYQKREQEAGPDLRQLTLQIDSVRHPAPAARARWLLAAALERMKRHKEVLPLRQSAGEMFKRAGEGESHGDALRDEAWGPYLEGDSVAAYRKMHEALLELRPYRGSIKKVNALLELSEWATRDGMQWAAMAIQAENFDIAFRVKEPHAAVEALLLRARVSVGLGESGSIASDLDSAAVLAKTLGDSVQRDRFANEARYSRAVAGMGSLASLDSSIAYFTNEKMPEWRQLALIRRAGLHLSRDSIAGATADLDSIAALTIRLSRGEAPFHLRWAVAEQARTLLDRLVMLHVRAGREREALEVLERGRVSFAPFAEPISAGRRRLAAPAGHVALEYAIISDTLLIWAVRDTAVTLVKRPMERDTLLLAIERMSAVMETRGHDSLAFSLLQHLYDWLIRPVERYLGAPGTPLLILADGEIAAVPFAALFDRLQERHLVDDHAVTLVSSLAEARRPAPSASPSELRALLVGDPAFDPKQHPTLNQLDSADAEVRALKKHVYPGATVLRGHAATLQSLRARAPGRHVIHYAGHAVFDDTRPERSFLVLAGEERLSADSAGSMDLRETRLVVLSACRTLRARQGRSGGFAGLSGALLSAGAGGVVGTLWEVDDERTQPLMLAFHREYETTGDAAEALRSAQLEMLRTGESPALWAAFRYVAR
jgi:CHAT domain-containing protein/tetratricopeptide (TPR) repeat protein